tara:strand:+ start:342 stop:668 length:327 start_codon:yes stop_codon:yes gene_type:complete
MSNGKGIDTYKKYWEDQASFMDQVPWNFKKILKLTFSNDFENKIKKFYFSNHSISKENEQLVIRLKVPYNYFDIDDFDLKAIELLGIDTNWVKDMSLENLKCTHSLKK